MFDITDIPHLIGFSEGYQCHLKLLLNREIVFKHYITQDIESHSTAEKFYKENDFSLMSRKYMETTLAMIEYSKKKLFPDDITY